MIVAQARGVVSIVPEALERSPLGVEAVDPAALGADPERAVPVLRHHADEIVADTGRVAGFMPVVSEPAGSWIEEVEASPEGADPEGT